jgi:hypothetical protein
MPNRNGHAQKRNGGGGGPPHGSDSPSGDESLDSKVTRDAFWGLVRLFIQCHEHENKALAKGSELSEKAGAAPEKTSKGKSNSKVTGKKVKGSK